MQEEQPLRNNSEEPGRAPRGPRRRVRRAERVGQERAASQTPVDGDDDGHEQTRALRAMYSLVSPMESMVRSMDINNMRLTRTVQLYYDRLERENMLEEGDWRPWGPIVVNPYALRAPGPDPCL